MNVYEKLQTVRVELQKTGLKKSGKNSYSNFDYFELSDFLPSINELCLKHGLCTSFSMEYVDGIELAYLSVIDSAADGGKITFSAPTAEVEIGIKKDGTGGAQPIQNQGGKITYMRRYLLIMAFEIVENDIIDKEPQEVAEKLENLGIEPTTCEKHNIQRRISKLGKEYCPECVKEYRAQK